jgi:hypothetical protein
MTTSVKKNMNVSGELLSMVRDITYPQPVNVKHWNSLSIAWATLSNPAVLMDVE